MFLSCSVSIASFGRACQQNPAALRILRESIPFTSIISLRVARAAMHPASFVGFRHRTSAGVHIPHLVGDTCGARDQPEQCDLRTGAVVKGFNNLCR
jgi:hypothetical protein